MIGSALEFAVLDESNFRHKRKVNLEPIRQIHTAFVDHYCCHLNISNWHLFGLGMSVISTCLLFLVTYK